MCHSDGDDMRRVLVRLLMTVAFFTLVHTGRAEAQLGALLSPGPLTESHAKLEGASNCTQCHERGRGVAAPKCLTCHQPVADRIARKVGVHRNVTTDCVACHVEHHGRDGELRPFDLTTFDHTRDTSFPLDGEHRSVATKCESCHTTRSFLAAKATCVSCHTDVHKGALGNACESCHSTSAPFDDASRTFDHARTKFPLTGAHRSATCESCHTSQAFAGVPFASCASCHKDPHDPALPGACSSCHGTDTWRTRRFDHATTSFPLAGRHAALACVSCHKTSALRDTFESTSCASCHVDPHRGEFTEDCASCHTETSFTNGTFDHTARTRFALTEKHAGLTCVACHTTVQLGGAAAKTVADFRGLERSCMSCHADPHEKDLGDACETCHSSTTFALTSFEHPRERHLFEAAHATLGCEACHTPAPILRTGRVAMAGRRFTETPVACASCHRDVHLGQLDRNCAVCHVTTASTFAIAGFDHSRTPFQLTGAHATTQCVDCHEEETGAFPAGAGTAVRFSGVANTCVSCHTDVHLGQLARTCETCHSTASFTLAGYTHKTRDRGFFAGPHLQAECAACHKPVERRFSSGTGRATDFSVTTRCVGCHTDVHRGAMGNDCSTCHSVARFGSR
jgi:hypothetical protein